MKIEKIKNNYLGSGFYLIISAVISIILVELIIKYLGWSNKFIIISESSRKIIAFIIIIIGILVYLKSIKLIKNSFNENKLCKDGIYSKIRHPLYSSILLILIPGAIIYWGESLAWLIFIIELITFHITIKKEEDVLLMKFGDEYREYMKKVKRIIPRIY